MKDNGKNSKIERIIVVLDHLADRYGASLNELRSNLGVSKRTIFRYFEILRLCRLPVFFNESTKRYTLGRIYSRRILQCFTEEEVRALASVFERMGKEADCQARSALVKTALAVRHLLPEQCEATVLQEALR